MGVEFRRGRPYLYRKQRRGGRVVSVYVGAGEGGALADSDSGRRTSQAEARRADRERLGAAEWGFAAYFERVEGLARAALHAAGFHRHKRGEWRRRRAMPRRDAKVPEPAAQGTEAVRPPAKGDEVRRVLDRAQSGDRGALPAVRALLDDPERGPHATEVLGSPACWLRVDLVELVAGQENLAVREAAERTLERVRAELEGPDPSPLERLLAERAAACWFLVNRYESLYLNSGEMSLALGDYRQRLIDRAHRRFLSAVKTLAQVRKLALPALQVNVAQNQVNVAGGG